MERLIELHELMGGGLNLLTEADVVAAHNIEFDLRLLRQSGIPDSYLPKQSICTWRCAQHVWPDAPKHSNQTLRYWLGLEVPTLNGEPLPPHRALSDATVTAWILMEMLRERPVDELLKLTGTYPLLKMVTKGVHRGRTWESMDTGYLKWILSKDFSPTERHTAQHWLDIKTGKKS